MKRFYGIIITIIICLSQFLLTAETMSILAFSAGNIYFLILYLLIFFLALFYLSKGFIKEKKSFLWLAVALTSSAFCQFLIYFLSPRFPKSFAERFIGRVVTEVVADEFFSVFGIPALITLELSFIFYIIYALTKKEKGDEPFDKTAF